MVKDSAKYSIILTVGQVLSTVVSALTMIFIARTIGAESYGEYTLALIPVSVILLLQNLGINLAITRFCALYRAEGRTSDLKQIVRVSLLFVGAFSIILCVSLYLLSTLVATYYLNRPDLTKLVQAVSITIIGDAFMQNAQAILVGYEFMGFRSLIQVAWSVIRGILAAILLSLGLGSLGATFSHSFSFLLAGIIGIIILFTVINLKNDENKLLFWGNLKLLLGFGFPLYMGTLVRGGLGQIFNTVMALNIPPNLIGNYSVATNFGVLVSFLTIPIATVLYPLFSKFKKNDPYLKNLYLKSVKYTAIITIPIIGLIMVLATPLVEIIYGDGYPYVSQYLTLYLVVTIFEGFGWTTQTNLIMGIGESRVSFLADVANFLVGVPLVIILTPNFQVYGLIFASIIFPWGGWLYKTIWMRKNLGFTVKWSETLRIYISNIIPIVVTYLIINSLHLQTWLQIFVGVPTFLIIYLITLALTRSIKKSDIDELSSIASIAGPLKHILKKILSLYQTILTN